jgi:F0F1-type ATP synthase membrane subunit b/b'
MSTTQRPQSPPTADVPSAGDPDLQRVRDILFGAQARTTQQQLQELEQRFTAQLQSLRQELDASRQSDGKKAEQAVQQAVAQAAATWQREREALAADVNRQIQALRDGKLDRAAMAELLAGLAGRIGKSGGD